MARKNPIPSQKERLLEANASRCCVCKRAKIGFNFHHIDGDSGNTVDENLAILCVEDHDAHHRPLEYPTRSKHLELEASEIFRHKKSWENFVKNSRSPNPSVVATISLYGTEEQIHSIQLVLQWPDERIEHSKAYHLLDGTPDQLTDRVIDEVTSISTTLPIFMVEGPLGVEHCPCCGTGFSRTVKPAVVARFTDPLWSTESLSTLYIDPTNSSLAITLSLSGRHLMSANLHVCNGKFLHFHSDGIDERIPIKKKPSIRAQATNIVGNFLHQWSPALTIIGTGDQDNPRIISDLELPKVWEVSTPSVP